MLVTAIKAVALVAFFGITLGIICPSLDDDKKAQIEKKKKPMQVVAAEKKEKSS